MSQEKNKPLWVKAASALISIGGLWLLGAWLLSALELSASDAPPALLTFQSPIGNPELSLAKTVNNTAPEPGEVIMYTLAYSTTNPGSRAFNVRLYDFLPDGVQYMWAVPPPSNRDGQMLLFTAPSVGPTKELVNVQVRVRDGYEQLHNDALMMVDFITPTHASLETSVKQIRWLYPTKMGYEAVLIKDELVYILHCKNTSKATVTDVKVMDVLPTGLPLVGASPWPDEVQLPLLSWSLGDLEPMERRTIVISTTAPASASVITNTALADARQRVVTQTMFATQVITEGAILRVTKKGSAPIVDLGDELVYTLQYRNAGNEEATDVVLTDTLPSDVAVIGMSTPPTGTPPFPSVTWYLGTLPPTNPGEIAGEIVITVTVGGKGNRELCNAADITGPGSFSSHAELCTLVRPEFLYLPLVMRSS